MALRIKDDILHRPPEVPCYSDGTSRSLTTDGMSSLSRRANGPSKGRAVISPASRVTRERQAWARTERTPHEDQAARIMGWTVFVIRKQVGKHRSTRNGRVGACRDVADESLDSRAGNTHATAAGLYTHSGEPCRHLRTTYTSGRSGNGARVVRRAGSKAHGHH